MTKIKERQFSLSVRTLNTGAAGAQNTSRPTPTHNAHGKFL